MSQDTITTGGRPVSVNVPTLDFMKGMRGAKSQKAMEANANLMTSVTLPLFSGKDLEDDKRSQFPNGGKIDLNLGKLADVPGKVLDMLGTTQKAPCSYTGNTPDEKPVTIKTVRNLSEQNPQLRDSVRMTMDLQAIANANDIERDIGRRAKGLEPIMSGNAKEDRKNPALGRIATTMTGANSVNGVTGICADSVNYNLANMTGQNYLMTAKKSDPAASMVSKDTVAAVGDLYTKEFTKFVMAYAEKDCNGIKPSTKQDDGTFKVDKSAKPIDGTAFSSLKSMGIEPVKLDNGGMVLACVDGGPDAAATRKGEKGLTAFNEAFNKHMSQVVNGSFPEKSSERNLGNNVGIQVYQTTAPGKDSMTMFQPSMTFTSRPYANALTRSVECATHQNTKSVEDLYGKEVLDNTRKIQDYFPDKTDAQEKDKVLQEVHDKLAAKGLEGTKSYEAAQRDGADGPQY